MHNAWRWFWRIIGILALASSTVCALFLYALWKATDLRPVAAGKAVELDSISLQLDILSLTLTAVGILLGVIGLFGYQNIRDVAVARAAEEARRTAQAYWRLDGQMAGSYVAEDGQYGSTGNPGAPSPSPANRFDPASISTVDAVKEKRSDDERDGSHGGDQASSGASAGADSSIGQ